MGTERENSALKLLVNILFLSHAANRSGAPLVLLNLLRYLDAETNHRAAVLSLRPGLLVEEWLRVAEVVKSPTLQRYSQLASIQAMVRDHDRLNRLSKPVSSARRLKERVARRAARDIWRRHGPFDAVYANSLATGAAVEAFAPFLNKVPLITHVHELEWVAQRLETQTGVFRTHTNHFIAASDAVNEFLSTRLMKHDLRTPVTTIHEWLDFQALETDHIIARSRLRAQLNISDDAFLVGGCGTMEWRKGSDLWVQVAAKMLTAAPNAYFVWLGGEKNAFRAGVEFDAKRLGIASRVRFLQPSSQPAQFFAGLDAFALTSREDPFPLVAIEAAAQRVPLVCFKDAGGAPELLSNEFAPILCTPYGDTQAMAGALQALYEDRGLHGRCGQQVFERAHELSDVCKNAPRVIEILESLQNQKKSRSH